MCACVSILGMYVDVYDDVNMDVYGYVDVDVNANVDVAVSVYVRVGVGGTVDMGWRARVYVCMYVCAGVNVDMRAYVL